jgi:cobalt/nickel transport protein
VSRKNVLLILAAASVALAAFVSPFASTLPDGLERVAEKLGFVDKGNAVLESPAPDYSAPGIQNGRFSGSVAGVLGAGIVFLSAYLVGRALFAGKPPGCGSEGRAGTSEVRGRRGQP